MEHRIETCPFVQILDAPVPQMGDQVLDLLQKIVSSLVEPVQVLAVPKISLDCVPQRSALPVPQTAEQLVEVLTNPGYTLAVVASKLCSRREIRRILSGLGSTASGFGQVVDNPCTWRSSRFSCWTEFNSVFGAERLFLRVGEEVAEVFKVLSQYRIQQRLRSRSLTFQLVAVFKVFSQARVLPHRVDFMTALMMEFMGFSALFRGEKSAEVLRQSSARVPASPSCWALIKMASARESDESGEDGTGDSLSAAYVALRRLRRREGGEGEA